MQGVGPGLGPSLGNKNMWAARRFLGINSTPPKKKKTVFPLVSFQTLEKKGGTLRPSPQEGRQPHFGRPPPATRMDGTRAVGRPKHGPKMDRSEDLRCIVDLSISLQSQNRGTRQNGVSSTFKKNTPALGPFLPKALVYWGETKPTALAGIYGFPVSQTHGRAHCRRLLRTRWCTPTVGTWRRNAKQRRPRLRVFAGDPSAIRSSAMRMSFHREASSWRPVFWIQVASSISPREWWFKGKPPQSGILKISSKW